MDLLDVGDLVYLSAENDQVKLDQIPQAQSSLISFNPKTGEVLSYVGGRQHKRVPRQSLG